MAPQINLNELYNLKKKRDQHKTLAFDQIIEQCHRRIRNIANHGGMNTFFEIPGLLIGYPLYNIHDCMNYVVEKMRKNGFLVQILPPPHVCVLYISWDPAELKPKKTVPAIEPKGGMSGGGTGVPPAPSRRVEKSLPIPGRIFTK
jgi:hypothetical protein